MPFPTYTTEAYFDRLTALKAQQYPVAPAAALMCLYKNDVSPDANMTPATFEEATFEDYASIPVVMGAPSLNDQGLVVLRSGLMTYATPPGAEPQTIYGLYITNSAGTKIIAAQRFDTAQTMGGALPTAISGVWRCSEPLSSYGWLNAED